MKGLTIATHHSGRGGSGVRGGSGEQDVRTRDRYMVVGVEALRRGTKRPGRTGVYIHILPSADGVF